jgi:hypothetical protein
MVRQFEKRVTSLAAGGREAGGDFVSDCVQDFAVATPQFSQDHTRTDLTLAWLFVAGMSGSFRNRNHSWR